MPFLFKQFFILWFHSQIATNSKIQQGLYHGFAQGQNNLWMTPAEFNDYLSWPGHMHIFSGRHERLEFGLELKIHQK